MKRWMFLWVALLCASLAAQEKKEIVLNTEVADVTVFIKGAQVMRKATAAVPAGKSVVRFTGLSPYADAKSVQVKIDGEVMVLAVNYQLNYTDTIKPNAEVEKYTKQIADLDEKIKVEYINKTAVAEELSFLGENKHIGGTTGVNVAELKSASLYYGERVKDLKMKDGEIDKRLYALYNEKSLIERKLAEIGTAKPEPSGGVMLTIESKVALRAPVELSYYVDNAGWYPSYDIRAKSISDPIELIYKGNVMQNTKENWKNVQLKISSGNPNLGSVAPQLKTYLLNYYTAPPRYEASALSNQVKGRVRDASLGEPLLGATIQIKGTTIGTISDFDGNFSLTIPSGKQELVFSYTGYIPRTLPISGGYMDVVLNEEQQLMDEVSAIGYTDVQKRDLTGAVDGRAMGVRLAKEKSSNTPLPVAQVENQTMVEFEIKTPYTILSENKNTTVELEHYSLPATYQYYCVPKVDKDAFLLANISDWEQYNLLEGEANIFFENTYVGKTILDVRSQSDTLSLSLGRDKNVSVQREKIKEYTSRKFLGSKAETTRAWKISVKNNKRQPISMVLLDQIPVSTVQEIEVLPEKLSGGVLTPDTGEVKWEFTLQPQQTNDIDFRYKVKYPKGRTLNVE